MQTGFEIQKKVHWTVVIGLLALLHLAGCNKTPTASGSYHERERAKIEQGHYDQAIHSLSQHLQRIPTDTEARVLLSSAYAARSGFALRDFSGFAELVIKGVEESPRARGEESAAKQIDWEIAFVFRLIESIPRPKSGIGDVVRAVEALNVQELPKSQYLYRAVLRLIIFKHNFEGKYHLRVYSPCQVRPHELRRWYVNVEKDLQEIVNDVLLSRRNPEEIEKLRAFQLDLAESMNGINEGLDEYMSQPLVKLPGILKRAYPECQK